MNWQRKLGFLLVSAGGLLCAGYILPTAYGSAMEHLALARFRAGSGTNRLWDSARIRAYRRTLDISFPPPVAVLRIPRVGVEVPVLEGFSDATLNRGAGHIPGTALPGQIGNLAITGHRDGFFRPLKDIAVGDIVELQRPMSPGTQTANTSDRYVVRSLKVVAPSDTSVLNPTVDSTLTLITCYPFYFIGAAPERFVVQAALLPATPVATLSDHPLPGE